MSGSINFQYYSGINNNRENFIAIEDTPNVQNVASGSPSLIIGQMNTSASATANQPILAVSQSNVNAICGADSIIADQYNAYIALDPTATVYLLPLKNSGGGTAGVQSITVSGTATSAGTVPLYVCGNYTPVAITSGQTSAQVATAVAAAIQAAPTLPVTATAASSVVTCTANLTGLAASDISLLPYGYYGPTAGENMVPGITMVVATVTLGASDPDLTAGLAACAANSYDYIVNPYTAPGSLVEMTAFLNESSGQWSPTIRNYGQSFSCLKNSLTNLVSAGEAINDAYQNILGVHNSCPVPAWRIAASFAAACAVQARVNPAIPLRGQALNILGPTQGNLFNGPEQNTLLHSGISTFDVIGGAVVINRAITTYELNSSGIIDGSYLDTETVACLAYVNRAFVTDLGAKFQKKILVADGTPISAQNNFITSQDVKAEAIMLYSSLAALGIVQDVPSFIKGVQAINAGNGAVSLYAPVNLANQLRAIGIQINFSKS